MRYQTYRPAADLASFVECYWTLRGDSGGLGGPERILPDGCFELIFNFADPFEQVGDDGSRCVQPLTLLAGQLTRYMQARPTGVIDLLAVRFDPVGASSFFPGPLHAFTDATLSGSDVDPFWGPLREMLGNTSRVSRITVLERGLRSRIRPMVSDGVVAATHQLKGSAGLMKIRDLSQRLGLSESALQRAFRRYVGIGPKTLARVFRVQSALDLRYASPGATVSEIAHRSGYFDHAHFTRDFAAVTGLPPSAFFESRHVLSDMLTDSP